MTKTWKQERPTWCPEQECIFKRRAMDSICGGHLPAARPHNGDANTFNLCLRVDGRTDRYEMNKTDFWWLRYIMDGVEETP